MSPALDEIKSGVLHALPGWRFTTEPDEFGWAPGRHYRARMQRNSQTTNVIIRNCWTDEGFDTELFMYRQLLPQIPIRTPKLFCSFVLTDGAKWMVLEDIGTATVNGDMQSERLAFFISLGTLHGYGQRLVQNTDVPLQVFSPDTDEYREWDALLTQAIAHPDHRLKPWTLDLFHQSLLQLAQQPATVLHGDTDWSNAILLDDGVGLVDWERAQIGPAALDMGRLMCSEVTECELYAYQDAYCRSSSTEITFAKVNEWAQLGSIMDDFRWICYLIRQTELGNPPDVDWQRNYYDPCITRMAELSWKSS